MMSILLFIGIHHLDKIIMEPDYNKNYKAKVIRLF